MTVVKPEDTEENSKHDVPCPQTSSHAEDEVELSETSPRYRTMFEKAPVGVAQLDSLSGRFVQMNPRYCEIIGYSRAEIEAKTFQEITHPEDIQEDLDHMAKLVDGAIDEFSMEKRYYRKDQSIVWVNLTVSRLWRDGQAPDFHMAVVEDITSRKELEAERDKLIEELRKSLADVKQLGGMLPICMSCKKIQDDRGYWSQLEQFLSERADVQFSHGVCPECLSQEFEDDSG
jgi:PAS domain S-box-containing protein